MPLLDHHLTLNLNHLPQTTTKYHYSVLGLTSFGMKEISMQGYILLITVQQTPLLHLQFISRELQGNSNRKITGYFIALLKPTQCCWVVKNEAYFYSKILKV